MGFTTDVAIVGGCGRVGLPLGLAFASRGRSVVLYDVDAAAVASVSKGAMPVQEPGGAELLQATIGHTLHATTDRWAISEAEHVVVVVGTPIDEHLNPDPNAVISVIDQLQSEFVGGQLLVLRSTVFPGVTRMVDAHARRLGLKLDVAFCPERIAEGHALHELFELPQIVAAFDRTACDRAEKLFRVLTDDVVRLEPEEAELAKLFTNTWRYIKFATANQFFMIANDRGLDFEKIRQALSFRYPRAADMPGAGFAAGPCLFKDAMQLAAFNDNNFVLGHASMTINEGLPLYVVARMEKQWDLSTMTVGILGMAFKAESDDNRSSLSYKLRRILKFKAQNVLCTDPYVSNDPDLTPLTEVLERSDVLVIAAPHGVYGDLTTDVPVVDIWNLRGDGIRI
jgi:UDP-N-acetyl-D-mannosaminuronic acid dehydrogenase